MRFWLLTYKNRVKICAKNDCFIGITVKKDNLGKKVVNVVKPKQRYTHAKAGDLVNVTLEKDRKHVKSGTYTARVKTPTKTGVEVKIDEHRISTKLFNFIQRSDGYSYSFAHVLSI